MCRDYQTALECLPNALREVLARVPTDRQAAVQEIRLRAGQAVALSIRGAEWYVLPNGGLSAQPQAALECVPDWLFQTVDRVCECSLYAHQEELRRGFLTAPNGCRVGVAGTAMVENGQVGGYRRFSSLCVRVAREHRGCAAALAAQLLAEGVRGTLLCGPPSSGKTSVLRDLLRELAARRLSVTVVDERGELSGRGVPASCDVLRGVPKAVGIEQAVRCLAPQAVMVDELGGEVELRAVQAALHSGVPVLASVHGRCPEELWQRAELREALRGGAFAWLVQLRGCDRPGEIAWTRQTEEWVHEMDRRAVGGAGGAVQWADGYRALA